MKENANDTLLTLDGACEFLNVSRATLYRRTAKREIPFAKMPGSKRLFFSKSELTAWVLSNR